MPRAACLQGIRYTGEWDEQVSAPGGHSPGAQSDCTNLHTHSWPGRPCLGFGQGLHWQMRNRGSESINNLSPEITPGRGGIHTGLRLQSFLLTLSQGPHPGGKAKCHLGTGFKPSTLPTCGEG